MQEERYAKDGASGVAGYAASCVAAGGNRQVVFAGDGDYEGYLEDR